MRIQNWTRWHQESDQAQETLRRFSRASEKTRGYAYEAGWLSSAYLRMIMSLPRGRREQELRLLEQQTRDLEAEQVVAALTNKC